MGKDIFFLKNKPKYFTSTVKRFIVWSTTFFLLLFIVFNVFLISSISHILQETVDQRIYHEFERVTSTFLIECDTFKIITMKELKESDFQTITDNPYFLQVFTEDEKIILESKNLKLIDNIPFSWDETKNKKDCFVDTHLPKTKLRTYAAVLAYPNEKKKLFVQLSAKTEGIDNAIDQILLFNIMTLPALFVLIFLLSLLLAKKLNAPLEKIISTAERITLKNLSTRIKYNADPNDELGRLRDTLNKLFDRLEYHINSLSTFSDNASHQLMTPLTVLKSEIDFALKRERSLETYKETLIVFNEQTERMIKIIQTLFIISKSEQNNSERYPIFNASSVIKETILPLYRNYKIEAKITKEIYLKGNAEYFSMAISNLIENALKFSKFEKTLISLMEEEGKTVLTISDFGIGIADHEKEKIFDRFYRSPMVEKKGIEGKGLGLSLVKSVVWSMQGILEIKDNKPKGTTIILRFTTVKVS